MLLSSNSSFVMLPPFCRLIKNVRYSKTGFSRVTFFADDAEDGFAIILVNFISIFRCKKFKSYPYIS